MTTYPVPAGQDGVTITVTSVDPAVVHWPYAIPAQVRVAASGGAVRFGFRGSAASGASGVTTVIAGQSATVNTAVEANPLILHVATSTTTATVTVTGYREPGVLISAPIPSYGGGSGGGGSAPDATTNTKGVARLLGGTADAPTVPWASVTEKPAIPTGKLADASDLTQTGAVVGKVPAVVGTSPTTYGLRTLAELGAAGAAAPSNSALAKMRARIASRDAGPRVLVFAGSSTTEGANATATARRFVNVLAAAIQAAYPLRSGAAQPATTDLATAYAGRASLAPGVQAVNAGVSGTNSGNYLTSTTRPQVAALSPAMVMHMVGSNDFANQVPIATFKAAVQAQITDLKSAITAPCVHVLVHSYERFDAFTKTIPWSAYGQALAEIAAADPSSVAFLDISGSYAVVGVPGSDPADVIDTDSVHQNDPGHAFMADLLRAALTIPPAGATAAADTTAPSVPTNLAATPGDGIVALTWTASTDNVAVSGYRIYRSGTQIGTTTSTSYTDTGRTNGTQYPYTVAATDAAGNVSAQTAAVTATPAAGGGGGGSGTTLLSDTFTRADSASLGSADTGQAWSVVAGTAGIAGNRAAPGADSGTALIEAGAANIDVSLDVVYQANAGLVFRAADINTRMGLFLDSSFNGFALYATPGGVRANAASTQTLTPGATYTIRVVAVGSTITAYLNGVQLISHTLSSADQTTYNALTKVGFRNTGSNGGTRFDNLIAKSAA